MKRRAFLATAGLAALGGCQELLFPDGSEDATASTPADGPGPSTSGNGASQSTADRGSNGGTEGGGRATETPNAVGTRQSADSPAPGVPVADQRLPLPTERDDLRRQVRSSGRPKDGIPSINRPQFVERERASERLADGDVVFGLERGGVAKAYPQRILVYHEVCNDTVDGDPVSVTYCPLTGTAMGFERGGTAFGVSGRLLNSNLILYDRWNETWWPQLPATAVPGPWNESPRPNSLREFRLVWTTWRRWREYRPDTLVLSEETGYVRNYGDDPYGGYNPRRGYYDGVSTLYPKIASNDRFRDKRVVVGARTPDGAVAFLKDALREKKVVGGTLAGDPVVAVYDQRLDTGYVYRNPDATSVTVADDAVRIDGETHDPDDLPLERVYALDAMWFAWYGFYPEGAVYA
jgi:hypothetical protein